MDVHFVRVTTDDWEHRVWAAATSREDAVDCVLDRVPEGWTVCLVDEIVATHHRAVIDMTPGEVRELAITASSAG